MRKHIFFALLMLPLASVAAAQTLVDIATDATDPFDLDDSEPSIAVNPLNPLEIRVVTFAEGWSLGTALGPVWVSNDGGVTWDKKKVLTAPSASSPAPGDQKLAYSASGTLYVAELGLGLSAPRCFIYRPSGPNWIPGTAFGDDQPMIESSGTTRLSPWLNFGVSPEQSTSERTTDDGVTVSQMGIGSTAFPNRTTRIAVGPTGAIYVLYKTRQGISGQFETATFRVVRSTDSGVTWNSPGVAVHPGTVQTWFTSSWGNNKNGGKFARARSSDGWIAVNPTTGAIWVVFCNRDGSGFGQIYAASSTDSGSTWSAPVRVTDGTHHSAYPEIAVAANGAVGVLYIDYDDSAAQTVYTHRFARSRDNGATWTRTALQSLTTQALANGSNGFLWGDYEGLTAGGNTFYGVFTGQSIGRAVVQLDPIFFSAPATDAQIQVPGGVNLGQGCVGAASAGTLTVCSTGKDNLIVTGIASSNAVFAVTAPSSGYPVTIAPGSCFPFQVVFNPAGPGAQAGTLTIASNDAAHPSTTVPVSASAGVPDIRVTGSTDFGTPSAWTPAEKTVDVCNVGTCSLAVTAAATTCADFELVTNPFPATLAPGACLDLVVRFVPRHPGRSICQLTVASNDPNQPTVTRTLAARTPPFFSLHAGLVEPRGAFHAVAGRGGTLNLDFVYTLTPRWAWDVRLGASRFDGRAGQPDVNLVTLSANARFTLTPVWPIRLFVNGGLGLYDFHPGDFVAGGNVGAGLNVPLGHLFALEATYNFHSAFNASPARELHQIQLGLLTSF
jgi:HYDIN/CFA65/VesB family protein